MTSPSNELLALAAAYRSASIEFSDLRRVTLAQWILESGWGRSRLAVEHRNFGGLKWRDSMAPFAVRVSYAAHDGTDHYCSFPSFDAFIRGYWAFLDRPPYKGWRANVQDPEAFITFIGSIYAEDKSYAEKVLDLIPAAESLLEPSGGPTAVGALGRTAPAVEAPVALEPNSAELHHLLEQAEEGDTVSSFAFGADNTSNPAVSRFVSSPFQNGRDGKAIDHVVLHYTTSRNIEGTISHFKNGSINPATGALIRTSAHYIVGRDGELVQMVLDSRCAWHAGNKEMNQRSIGIEHVAAPGDRITPAQEATSLSLLRWIIVQYGVPRSHIIPHNRVKATSCPGDLFDNFGEDHTQAIARWLAEKLEAPVAQLVPPELIEAQERRS